MIIYGTYFGGKTKKLDNQWIETKFVLLMIPLFPISTMFVTSKDFNQRQGLDINVTGGSVIHGYIRFIFLFATIAALICSLNYNSFRYGWGGPLTFPLLFVACASILAWSHLQKTADTSNEVLERRMLGSIMGFNALPEWLPLPTVLQLTQKLQNEVNEEFGSTDVIALARQPQTDIKKTAYLFALLRYKSVMEPENINLQSALKTVKDRYERAANLLTEKDFNTVRANMDDDMRDDVSKKIEK
jgi:hypothetical protein